MSDYSRGMMSGLLNDPGIHALTRAMITAPLQEAQAQQTAALSAAKTEHARQEAAKLSNLGSIFHEANNLLKRGDLSPEERNLQMTRQIGAYSTNAQQMAQALSVLTKDSRIGQMINGALTPEAVGAAYAAAEGKGLYDNVANTGVSLNKFTGKQETTHQGLYGTHTDLERSKIAENRAQAGNATASAERTRQATMHEKPGPIVQTERGTFRVPRDNVAVPVTFPDGAQVRPPAKNTDSLEAYMESRSRGGGGAQPKVMSQQDYDVLQHDTRNRLRRGEITREQAYTVLEMARRGFNGR